MSVERRLTIPGVLERVPEACEFVVKAAEAAGLDERAVYSCQLAVDEWCTNVIEHGFADSPANHTIQITCESGRHALSITVSDDSPAFDPTTLPVPDVSADRVIDDIQPGGLGWLFIHKMMDSVHYEFKNGRNNLTMVKHSAAAEGGPTVTAETVFPSDRLRDDLWLVMPSGRLDAIGGRVLEATVSSQLNADNVWIIIDMAAVNYISSGGLKVLIASWRKAQNLGGNIALAGLPPKVSKVFEISGFDLVFNISPSIEEAAATIKLAPK
jgi:serine/threonine-protein kinase RsbW